MAGMMNPGLTVDDVYPVGSIYMSVNATDPGKLFGGTWQRIKERFLLGAGDTHDAGSTGGEFEHTLTLDEMPMHAHVETKVMSDGNLGFIVNPNKTGLYSGDTLGIGQQTWTNNKEGVYTEQVGGSQPHNITPPYLAVYIWQRTA